MRWPTGIDKLRDHGRTSKYAHDEIGYGERLDGLQAAILAVKLNYLEQWNEARRRIAQRYTRALSDLAGVCTPFELPEARHVYHIYCVSVAGDRDAILAAMQARGIGAGIHYPIPLHRQAALAGRWPEGAFPHSERAAASILSLPIYPELTDEAIDRVVQALTAALETAAIARD
jgi:Predicted pyridoxal phosphate-dependent enzyme apparently involved in regulation of cell wall biogenesis